MKRKGTNYEDLFPGGNEGLVVVRLSSQVLCVFKAHPLFLPLLIESFDTEVKVLTL